MYIWYIFFLFSTCQFSPVSPNPFFSPSLPFLLCFFLSLCGLHACHAIPFSSLLIVGWLCSEILFDLLECRRILTSLSTIPLTYLLPPLLRSLGTGFFLCVWSAFKKRKILFIFRERGREGDREGGKHLCERESLISCFSHTPCQGPGPHPRHVSWLGIKLVTFRSMEWGPTHWATPVRDIYFLKHRSTVAAWRNSSAKGVWCCCWKTWALLWRPRLYKPVETCQDPLHLDRGCIPSLGENDFVLQVGSAVWYV